MSQTGQQIKTIHILPNVLRSKVNEAMTFSHLIKHSVTNFFRIENDVGRLISDLLLFCKKLYIK